MPRGTKKAEPKASNKKGTTPDTVPSTKQPIISPPTPVPPIEEREELRIKS